MLLCVFEWLVREEQASHFDNFIGFQFPKLHNHVSWMSLLGAGKRPSNLAASFLVKVAGSVGEWVKEPRSFI
jgi:hypothetical protein